MIMKMEIKKIVNLNLQAKVMKVKMKKKYKF